MKNEFQNDARQFLIALVLFVGALLLTGCEKREKDEPQRSLGGMFDTPCQVLADGSRRCSDVR